MMNAPTFKTKYNIGLIIVSVWVMVLGVCAALISVAFLGPLAMLLVVVGIYAVSMKCPHCDASIFCREDLAVWCSLRVPVTCRRCSKDLK